MEYIKHCQMTSVLLKRICYQNKVATHVPDSQFSIRSFGRLMAKVSGSLELGVSSTTQHLTGI